MQRIQMNHPVVRRKSAAERLAESKYKYIKSPVTPLLDRDVNTTAHRTVQKSLSAGVKPSVLVLTQSQPVHPSIDVPDHHEIPQSLKSPSAHPVLHTSSTLPNISSSAQLQPQPVIIRKRNSSFSSRLSIEANNLEQQLRQLIAENSEERNNENQMMSHMLSTPKGLNKNEIKEPVIDSKQSVIRTESQIKPKPRERTKSLNVCTNQQTCGQTPPAVPKRRTIFIINSDTNADNKTRDYILRYNSSHTNADNNNSKLEPKSSHPSGQVVMMRAVNGQSGPANRQMSISRSKSDVSNRLLVRRNKSKDEIERFFETLGLDSSVWDTIKSEATSSMISTPAHYFESCESLDSSELRAAVPSSNSSAASSTDRHSTSAKATTEKPQTLNTRLMQSRSCQALSSGTSIVEKNARVIKWLYNCRRALIQQ